MLVIVTWKWSGWRNIYTAEHVNKLGRMLAKHMSTPYRFVCITDDPEDIEFETFPLWKSEPVKTGNSWIVDSRDPVPNCFTRLKLFDPRVSKWLGASKILSIDLDCMVFDDLAPLLTEDPFKAAIGRHSNYCGTLWQLIPGAHERVWTEFDPIESPKQISNTLYGSRKISGSDQAWMSINIANAPTWGETEGVYWYREIMNQRKVPKNARVVHFAGGIKPWDVDCRLISPAFYRAYQEI